MLSSRARDLVERHGVAFALNQIKIPSPEDYPGEEYLQAFEETLKRLALWLEESA